MKVDFENGQLFKTHNKSSCFLLVLGHGPKKIMVSYAIIDNPSSTRGGMIPLNCPSFFALLIKSTSISTTMLNKQPYMWPYTIRISTFAINEVVAKIGHDHSTECAAPGQLPKWWTTSSSHSGTVGIVCIFLLTYSIFGACLVGILVELPKKNCAWRFCLAFWCFFLARQTW